MTQPPSELESLRAEIRGNLFADEARCLAALMRDTDLDPAARSEISQHAATLVRRVREKASPGLMEVFLAEYGLSTGEGVALMCLAEALLRVPDTETMDALIEDKIAPSEWGLHLGRSSSSLVNASTWALMLTGTVLEDETTGIAGILHGAIRRLGEPVIRVAVGRAMRELGRQFVLGRTIEEAMERGRAMERRGYTYSYDMLGEAARTEADARRYHLSYSDAITELAHGATGDDVRANPGISIKLSALHPRYEQAQRQRVLTELTERARSLALLARSAGMGLNIDAEEADRLDLSLDVIESLMSHPSLKRWDGFGVVVQAYGQRAAGVLDWLYALARKHDRRIMVRLVKGAYWDSEIKRGQVLGLPGFPVFTRKPGTDVSYIACARRLLRMTDRIYPQFATHNAHTISAVLHMAEDRAAFEFQRLHGMGETLHDIVHRAESTRCRIYAPVGAHRDLLAYLVRRLLENGASSSFVHRILDPDVPPEALVGDPFADVESWRSDAANPRIRRPAALYAPTRVNSAGFDLADPAALLGIDDARAPFLDHVWAAGPLISGTASGMAPTKRRNPADPASLVGSVADATPEEVEAAIAAAAGGAGVWGKRAAAERAAILRRAADLYEDRFGEIFACLAREAGKTLGDAVAELREAVDFLRYYAAEAVGIEGREPRGVIACISPWNFPLAIFTGQVSAALAAGNAVIAKPAEQTPLTAALAVRLLHEAGVPAAALQLLPGDGPTVGAALTGDPRIDGICFTGSTATAQAINRSMAAKMSPAAPLIAETGGINAMIVDSTALPEQAVRDIVVSAFQSAGQRCSALRILYLQSDIAEPVLAMLRGAMDELSLGDPWDLATDVGPVIDEEAASAITRHIDAAAAEGRLEMRLDAPTNGHFVGPALIRVGGIEDLAEEVFGPVLHVATFEAEDLDAVVADINAASYGLTFGLHTRIDDRVQQIVEPLRIGNIYVNRNQIGAVVGTQPFGGEGLSGTGPKAGGPHYLPRFLRRERGDSEFEEGRALTADELGDALSSLAPCEDDLSRGTGLPGPTGESNRLTLHPRGNVLCLGPGALDAYAQAREALAAGCSVLMAAPGAVNAGFDVLPGRVAALNGHVPADLLTEAIGLDAVALWADDDALRPYRIALAARPGPILPLVAEKEAVDVYRLERHICIDTTAAGGNASLLAASE